MGSMSEGEHWVRMRDMPIKQLVPFAAAEGFERGEEMARSLLRNKLVARRIRQTKGSERHHAFHTLEECGCRLCRDQRKARR